MGINLLEFIRGGGSNTSFANDPVAEPFKSSKPRRLPYKRAMTKKLGTDAMRVGPPPSESNVSFSKMKKQRQTLKNFYSRK